MPDPRPSSTEARRDAAAPARTWISWSSGKDSVFTLCTLRQDPAVEVVGLLTTMSGEADRVAMHAVRRELLTAQAARLDLPLHTVELPSPCPNEAYEERMAAVIDRATAEAVEQIAFGDLFLADVREYRERMLSGTGIRPLFPLWGCPTPALATTMIAAGVRAVLTCVDPAQMPGDLVGRPFDKTLLADLPAGVDPCGENGEFHTFVWDAPGFAAPIAVEAGEVVERTGFVYCDLRRAA